MHKLVQVYADDMVAKLKSWEKHVSTLKKILQRTTKVRHGLKLTKVHFRSKFWKTFRVHSQLKKNQAEFIKDQGHYRNAASQDRKENPRFPQKCAIHSPFFSNWHWLVNQCLRSWEMLRRWNDISFVKGFWCNKVMSYEPTGSTTTKRRYVVITLSEQLQKLQ